MMTNGKFSCQHFLNFIYYQNKNDILNNYFSIPHNIKAGQGWLVAKQNNLLFWNFSMVLLLFLVIRIERKMYFNLPLFQRTYVRALMWAISLKEAMCSIIEKHGKYLKPNLHYYSDSNILWKNVQRTSTELGWSYALTMHFEALHSF